MAERKTGAGLHLSGVLEKATPPKPAATEPTVEDMDHAVESGPAEAEPTAGRGRGSRRTAAAKPQTRKIKGRTIYLPDDLFERIMVQAHRRDKTISEYVTMVLERQVPDHRTIRTDEGEAA